MGQRKSPTQIVNTSQEFGEVEHQLQTVLNAPQLVVRECYDLRNPRANAHFMAKTRAQSPQNVVTVFIPTSEIAQTPEDIHLRGLRVDRRTGLRAKSASLAIDRQAATIEVLRVSLALGKVLNYQPPVYTRDFNVAFDASAPTSSFLEASAGYDSLCLAEDGEFIVFSSDQVQCCNLVRFDGGANLAEAGVERWICDLCKAEEATIWCVNDGAKFCAKCSETSHSNAIQRLHKRMNIWEARALMEFCPSHGEDHVEFFCEECKIPVCVKCKMIGSHATGECAVHELHPIRGSYDEAVRTSQDEYPIVGRRRSEIAQKLEEVKLVADDIWENTESIVAQIQEIARRAIEQAHLLGGQKLREVRSVRNELLRKEREMTAMRDLLEAHRRISGPKTFLQAYHRQSLIATALQEQTSKENDRESVDLPLAISIRGDLVLVGGALRVEPARKSPTRTLVAQHEEEEEAPPPEQPPDLFKRSATSPLRRVAAAEVEFGSLTALADKRKRRLPSGALNFEPFRESTIIESADERIVVYLCCPFKQQPETRLLFSTERDGRSLGTMHDLIDGIGITIIFIARGPYAFGGFAAAKWCRDGKPFGKPGSSFLFSITRDAHVPFKKGEKCPLLATEETLTFGGEDLVLADDFDNCSAVIEHNYGIGFPEGSEDAQVFLAGKPSFRADAVEVWGFSTTG